MWDKRKTQKKRNSFACFPAILIQPTFSTEVIMFLLLCVAETKDLLIQRTYSRTDLDKKKLYNLILNDIWDGVIVHVQQRFQTMKCQICQIVKSEAFSRL